MDLGFLDIQDSAFPTGICELVSHRDGQPWRRVAPDRPFLDNGPEGTYYRAGGMPLHNEPIVVNDELLLYFNTGSSRRPDERPIHPARGRRGEDPPGPLDVAVATATGRPASRPASSSPSPP